MSLAGVRPGNNESAGRHLGGRTRHGDRWLRGALGEAAAAAARTKGTHLAARYHRLAARRGKKRALVACSRTILEASWHILRDDLDYHDLGPNHHLGRPHDKRRAATRLTQQLQALGCRVTLKAA